MTQGDRLNLIKATRKAQHGKQTTSDNPASFNLTNGVSNSYSNNVTSSNTCMNNVSADLSNLKSSITTRRSTLIAAQAALNSAQAHSSSSSNPTARVGFSAQSSSSAKPSMSALKSSTNQRYSATATGAASNYTGLVSSQTTPAVNSSLGSNYTTVMKTNPASNEQPESVQVRRSTRLSSQNNNSQTNNPKSHYNPAINSANYHFLRSSYAQGTSSSLPTTGDYSGSAPPMRSYANSAYTTPQATSLISSSNYDATPNYRNFVAAQERAAIKLNNYLANNISYYDNSLNNSTNTQMNSQPNNFSYTSAYLQPELKSQLLQHTQQTSAPPPSYYSARSKSQYAK